MRPVVLNSDKKSSYIFLSFAVIVVVGTYMYFLNRYRIEFEKFLSKKNSKFDITYDSIKTSGLLVVNNQIENLRIRVIKDNNEYSIVIDKINIKNFIFTRNFTAYLGEKINVVDIKLQKNYVIGIDSSADIMFDLNGKGLLTKLDVFIPEIFVLDSGEKLVVKNFSVDSFKILNYDDIINDVIRVNIDSMLFYVKGKKGIKLTEVNLEILLSVLSELGVGEKVVNKNITVEKFIFNDITNNFAFSIDGEVKRNITLSTISSLMNLNIINYNSLIRTINDADEYIFINKMNLSTIVELLISFPASPQNTVNKKYYLFEYNTAMGILNVNNKDVKGLFENLFFREYKQ
ncbi:MAG: hypothetical protein LBG48_00775 [Rickettsiales bacterium]|jgi:hypothetical protein|nr:hypothetical protein [Rickettsiales bacterium]